MAKASRNNGLSKGSPFWAKTPALAPIAAFGAMLAFAAMLALAGEPALAFKPAAASEAGFHHAAGAALSARNQTAQNFAARISAADVFAAKARNAQIMVAQAQTAQPDPERAPKNTPGIPPLMRPERPSSDPYRPIPPESPPEGVMIVKPNPRAWQSPEAFQAPGSYQAPPEASEIYFHRQDPTGWPAALSKFAQSLEIRYFDWYSGTIGGALDEDVAWIFEELESAAAEGSDYEYSDYDRLWTSESLKAFLAQNLQALAVDREGYWHYMTIGEDEDWRPTGALYRDSFQSRIW